MTIARSFVVLSLLLSPLASQDLRVTEGPKDEQVIQRNPDGFATVKFKGTATGKKLTGKAVEARVLSSSGVVANLDWATVGRVDRQNWSAELRGIPTGGPYRIEVRIQDGPSISAVDNLLVGDLWVLAGQSNMEGVGDLVDVQPSDPMVHTFDLADHWRVAEEPLHTLVGATDRVHWRKNAQGELERITGARLQKYNQERKKGAGLGLPFAVTMVKRTGIPIGLIPCAHGGTSMDQWDPALKTQAGDSLYGSMLRRVVAAGGRVKGLLWYQGESDANAKAAPEFKRKFEDLIKAVRDDFKDTALPFYYVQIGRHISDANVAEWNRVQETQRQVELQVPHVGMVASVDLVLDDGIHVSTPDQKRLGRRLADLASHDLFPRLAYGDHKPGPRPVSAQFENGIVKVRFSSVNERLESSGRISGFTIHDDKGAPVAAIYKVRVDPAEASTVLLSISGKLPDRATLWYGFGKDPYCNLRDAADMAVPVFGPMEIKQ